MSAERYVVAGSARVTIGWSEYDPHAVHTPQPLKIYLGSGVRAIAFTPKPPVQKGYRVRNPFHLVPALTLVDPGGLGSWQPSCVREEFVLSVDTPAHVPRNRGDDGRLLDSVRRARSGTIVRFLSTYGGATEILIFDTVVEVPVIPDWRNFHRQPRKSDPPKPRRYSAYLRNANGVDGAMFAAVGHGLSVYAERFGLTVALDFATLANLPIGTYLNPALPLQRACDPLFATMPADEQGHNALTNFDGVSIPICYPANWNLPMFDGCRGLRCVGRAGWNAFVAFLLGKLIDEITDFPDLDNSSEPSEDHLPPRNASGAADIRLGECYDGPCERVACVGTHLVFTVQADDGELFVVDSPFWGIAASVFRKREWAMDWARGGVHRKRLRAATDFKREVFCHIPGWKPRLRSRIRPSAVDAPPAVAPPPPVVVPLVRRPETQRRWQVS